MNQYEKLENMEILHLHVHPVIRCTPSGAKHGLLEYN